MSTLLVIDDEDGVRYSLRYVFEEDGVEILTAATAADGLRLAGERGPDVVLLDLQLPDRSGLEIFHELRALEATRPVIFITAHGTTETAIEAMKQGAFDYLVKPVNLERLTQILTRAFEAARLMRDPAPSPPAEAGDRIVGRALVMQEMCKAIGRVAAQDVNVLICGESGTGKELVARALYEHSRRADKPFLAINCAAIPDTLLESELFGHEKGAFTGADRRRVGKFEHCDGGTLFLDEIGDMALPLQAKMLRVLQEQNFERLGGNDVVQASVRVLAATNQDLEKLVAKGRFRQDLYYRLKGVTIQVPPLRDRPEDVADLVHHFQFQFNRELKKDIRVVAPEALETLQRYAWPGNVRELQGVLRVAMLNASGHVLLSEFLPAEVLPAPKGASAPLAPVSGDDLGTMIERLLHDGTGDLHARSVAALERVLLVRVLRHVEGNQTQASELLGITRGTLRQKLRALGFASEKAFTHDGNPADTNP